MDTAALEQFRRQKDALMRGPESPLPPGERSKFPGLAYFPPNADLALTLEPEVNVSHDEIVFDTSDGQHRTYHRAAVIAFAVDGQTVQLTVFEDEHGYFLPFRDATSGHESYAAGRYLEPARTADGRLRVDFNYAYNPYCAYSPRFSCPLPPVENWAKVPIRAGEMNFHP